MSSSNLLVLNHAPPALVYGKNDFSVRWYLCRLEFPVTEKRRSTPKFALTPAVIDNSTKLHLFAVTKLLKQRRLCRSHRSVRCDEPAAVEYPRTTFIALARTVSRSWVASYGSLKPPPLLHHDTDDNQRQRYETSETDDSVRSVSREPTSGQALVGREDAPACR